MTRNILINLDYNALTKRFNTKSEIEAQMSYLVEDEAKKLRDQIRETIPAVGIRIKGNRLLNAVKYTMINDYTAKVYVDDKEAPYAKYLEHGYSAFSMREGLLSGKSSKISKKGFRYARIPVEGKVLTITEDRSSMKRRRGEFIHSVGNTRWHHPGYCGRLFFQQAVEIREYEVIKRVQKFLNEVT